MILQASLFAFGALALWPSSHVRVLAAPATGRPCAGLDPVVQITNGTLAGSQSVTCDLDLFLGIPYAAPPVGDLRFRPPSPYGGWNGTQEATSFGPWCLGNSINLAVFSQNFTKIMSEDCLHLNVIRPAGAGPGAQLPIVAWIHGGAWADGSAADERGDGSFLVQRSIAMETPMIFVSFNYRLGLFGMLGGSAARQAGATNLLLHDQRHALRWIQENIQAFGGDPARVTIMGESAGAGSVGYHLLAHGGRDDGLFSAAIAQSGGPITGGISSRTAQEQQQDFDSVLNATACTNAHDSLECLRGVPALVLNAASAQLPPTFIFDGQLLPKSPLRALRDGRFIPVPLLTGSNLNEGTSFILQKLTSPINTDEQFGGLIRGTFGSIAVPDDVVEKWTRLYQDEVDDLSAAGLGTVKANPGPEFGAMYGKATLWMGDFMFTAGRRETNQAWADKGVPSYGFLFDTGIAGFDPTTLGSAHFSEIPYTFGNTEGRGWAADPFPSDPTGREKHLRLVNIMTSMWISFVVSHSPNAHKVPGFDVDWPVYDNTSPVIMHFNTTNGPGTYADTWRTEAMDLFARGALVSPGCRSGHRRS
ncbi:Alpha/Beta hydrolase protein [Plectosphaerella plurivora]|uniref:Carboxylic ester hydrolase n=1 Tax=Plectosphaerella plurivora TaxID=936078 RepID=A0A9P8VCY6_9PEZI|nr:Alpha/Beta hydrolase protein [Plectosphaerella plurivora]